MLIILCLPANEVMFTVTTLTRWPDERGHDDHNETRDDVRITIHLDNENSAVVRASVRQANSDVSQRVRVRAGDAIVINSAAKCNAPTRGTYSPQ